MVLKLPETLAHQLGDGSLVIQLEVYTRCEEGLQEKIAYAKEKKYVFYTEVKTWTEAEAHCQSEGGNLASVSTENEWQKVLSVSGERFEFWLGGSDLDEEGVWRWTDGSLWNYTLWADGYGSRGYYDNCINMYKAWKSIHQWWDYDCH